ncbi:hypothetical protein PGT21_005427 [Puccinia graminis f. sp. tritici]|uniref:Uncharacterized protein n=1 Tax=Puccinia graminis f. sp. tritici TaxID=56615 RepID=A0A5B0MWF7_PUCGR|nr:hypothetical protein PGT21_005427 [Puccinia graminis f. sp. tritici]KAA1120428.1 hypothetical protein PGTUg99_016845 [Puccinia graminis f. sp. tritici]
MATSTSNGPEKAQNWKTGAMAEESYALRASPPQVAIQVAKSSSSATAAHF